jgi:hypothetical protein
MAGGEIVFTRFAIPVCLGIRLIGVGVWGMVDCCALLL